MTASPGFPRLKLSSTIRVRQTREQQPAQATLPAWASFRSVFAEGPEAERSIAKTKTKRSKWEVYNDLSKADKQLEVHKDKVPFHIALQQSTERASLDFEFAYQVCVDYSARNSIVYYGVKQLLKQKQKDKLPRYLYNFLNRINTTIFDSEHLDVIR